MQTKYLILGAGPAGAWAIRGIRQEDQQGKVLIVGSEPYRTYSLPLLTKGYIQGRFAEDALYLVKEGYYDKNQAIFIKGKRAVGADLKERRVILDDGTEIKYEKLLVTTGGRPRKFNIPGGDLEYAIYLGFLGTISTTNLLSFLRSSLYFNSDIFLESLSSSTNSAYPSTFFPFASTTTDGLTRAFLTQSPFLCFLDA